MQNKILLPLSIIIAGILIAGALYFGGNNQARENGTASIIDAVENILPISGDDHVLGNPNGSIKFIEYADPRCHFCRAFHSTMKKVMSLYGQNGEIAWIYRHFTILGPESLIEAHATECAADQGGNEAFWSYLDLLFESKDENGILNPALTLEDLAGQVGLDRQKFLDCQASGKFNEKIQTLAENAIASGAKGTPFTVFMKDGESIPLPGALPLDQVEILLETEV